MQTETVESQLRRVQLRCHHTVKLREAEQARRKAWNEWRTRRGQGEAVLAYYDRRVREIGRKLSKLDQMELPV
jgi:hypothetical protein